MIKILVLDLLGPQRDQIVRFFLDKEERTEVSVDTITVNSKTMGDYLLLPDTGGYTCISQAFWPHFNVPPFEIPGQIQWMSYWENYMLDYYLNKGISLVGFGTSAILLWDRVLSTEKNETKVTIDNGQLVPIENKKVALMNDKYEFHTDRHHGYPVTPLKDALEDFYSHHISGSSGSKSGGDNGGSPSPVPVTVGSGTKHDQFYAE